MNPYNLLLREGLKRICALIDTPDKWCQRAWAQDSSGNDVEYTSPEACKFCVQGAFFRVQEGFRAPSVQIGDFIRSRGWIFADIWALLEKHKLTPQQNDIITHAELMERVNGAINATSS